MENPNIFDIKSVIIEHPKTSHKERFPKQKVLAKI